MLECIATPPRVKASLPKGGAHETVDCPLGCGGEVDMVVYERDDVRLLASTCGHESDSLVNETAYLERVQGLAYARYERRVFG